MYSISKPTRVETTRTSVTGFFWLAGGRRKRAGREGNSQFTGEETTLLGHVDFGSGGGWKGVAVNMQEVM